MKLSRRDPRWVSRLAVWVPEAFALIEGCRYDSCFPASEVESYKIERLIGGSATPADHVVILTRVAAHDGPPTTERWASFGACVLAVWHPEDVQPSDADLANRVRLMESGVRF